MQAKAKKMKKKKKKMMKKKKMKSLLFVSGSSLTLAGPTN